MPRTSAAFTLVKVAPGKLGGLPLGRLRIRPRARDVLIEGLPRSAWLAGTLEMHGIVRLGDLDGRRIRDLGRLRRFGPTQLRELYRLLVAQDALDGHQVEQDVRAERRARKALLRAPRYEAVRNERIAIRAGARATIIDELPWPATVRGALRRAGRDRLGDLHGLSFAQVFGTPLRASMRNLHACLALAGVREPTAPRFEVPVRVRGVLLDDTSMPPPLRKALRLRRVRTLGDLALLTPALLGKKFGPVRMAALEQLVARASTMPTASASYARMVDEGLASLPADERRALLLRFGAKDRPLILAVVAAHCRWGRRDANTVLERCLEDLRSAGGVPLMRALREARERAGRPRRRLTSPEATRLLRLRGGRYSHEFYLRLVGALEPRLKVAVVWGKRYRPRT